MSRTKRTVPHKWRGASQFELTQLGIAAAGGAEWSATNDPRNEYATARDRKSKKSSRNTVRQKRENNRKMRRSGRILPSKQIW